MSEFMNRWQEPGGPERAAERESHEAYWSHCAGSRRHHCVQCLLPQSGDFVPRVVFSGEGGPDHSQPANPASREACKNNTW